MRVVSALRDIPILSMKLTITNDEHSVNTVRCSLGEFGAHSLSNLVCSPPVWFRVLLDLDLIGRKDRLSLLEDLFQREGLASSSAFLLRARFVFHIIFRF